MIKKQFIADDITLEALVDLHQEVPTGVGVFKDELAGWLKDMNKYREGSDLEFWLSTWSGTSVNVNRLTRVGSFVENPFIPVIGGIQPAVLNELYNQEKKDNGFMDRMLISYPDVTIPKYNDEEISTDAIIWYNSTIANLRKVIQKLKQETDADEIKKIEVYFNSEAKNLWINKFNEITEKQNSDNENEYFKSMYPKQKSYIPRFAFLLNALNSVCNDDIDFKIIEVDAMKGHIKIGNDSIPQRTNDDDVCGLATHHLSRVFADCGNAACHALHRDDGWLLEHNPLAFDKDKRRGRAKVDSNVGCIKQTHFYTLLSRDPIGHIDPMISIDFNMGLGHGQSNKV